MSRYKRWGDCEICINDQEEGARGWAIWEELDFTGDSLEGLREEVVIRRICPECIEKIIEAAAIAGPSDKQIAEATRQKKEQQRRVRVTASMERWLEAPAKQE